MVNFDISPTTSVPTRKVFNPYAKKLKVINSHAKKKPIHHSDNTLPPAVNTPLTHLKNSLTHTVFNPYTRKQIVSNPYIKKNAGNHFEKIVPLAINPVPSCLKTLENESGQQCNRKRKGGEVAQHNIKFVVFDLETHGWLDHTQQPGKKGRVGTFGHKAWIDEENLNFSRIVQVGWCVYGQDGGLIRSESRFVNDIPCGIQPKAARYHKITNAMVAKTGVALKDALRDVLLDFESLDRNNGILIGHHLEFDAGIFFNEMRRAGYSEKLMGTFHKLATAGRCTMHDAVLAKRGLGYWCRPSLDACYREFVAEIVPLKTGSRQHRHDAVYDVEMTWEVFIAMNSKTGPVAEVRKELRGQESNLLLASTCGTVKKDECVHIFV
eukprot:CAMPEP_0194397444 /NCGR_PEP_ID=MMETSP0174-20130528/125546_1 /TAXON_ID=216777 /ORGANISM="Proboscia alata, Strain PI-D3" /LENGTH=379 /DNA_ID=CAMNT_0039193619 /DNA_START=6 /DNA_END=1145 /DNA_ORIENTATION=+